MLMLHKGFVHEQGTSGRVRMQGVELHIRPISEWHWIHASRVSHLNCLKSGLNCLNWDPAWNWNPARKLTALFLAQGTSG